MSLRQQILAADDIKKERGVHIPEWNATVDVWGMTGEERARAVAAGRLDDVLDEMKLAAAVVIETVRDPATGERVLQPADRDALLLKSAGTLTRLAKIGLRLSGMSEDAREEITKNSVTASGDSTSASPKPST